MNVLPAIIAAAAVTLTAGCTAHHAVAGSRNYRHHHYPHSPGHPGGHSVEAVPSRAAGSCHATNSDPATTRPDPACTPGATNPDVTQGTIHSTICVSGYTKSIRPPVSYADALKRAQIRWYGYADTSPRDYEEDHFIPLSLGGAPSDPRNLWPETGPSTNPKDDVEFTLYRAVCDGHTTLAAAQRAIVANWTSAVARLHLPLLHSAPGA